MKCGTAASVWTAIYLRRLRDELPGRLTLTCVSDEETGGSFGAQWLLENHGDECRGDCLLNGEPSAGTIRFGEKGTLRLVFEIDTPGAHAACTYLSRNAIRVASDLVRDLYRLEEMQVAQSDAVRVALDASRAAMDAAVGQGAGYILDRVTPVWTHSGEPTFSDPGHRMVDILRDTVSHLTGRVPVPTISLGASDAKHWRRHGVPAYLYGCAPINMAKPDEWVDVEEYLNVVRTHALAAAAFLAE